MNHRLAGYWLCLTHTHTRVNPKSSAVSGWMVLVFYGKWLCAWCGFSGLFSSIKSFKSSWLTGKHFLHPMEAESISKPRVMSGMTGKEGEVKG